MENKISELVSTSMQNIKTMVDANTIIGEPVQTAEGVTIIPVSKVAFGFGAGGSEYGHKNKDKDSDPLFGGGTGGGVTINPVGFLVCSSTNVRFIPTGGSITAVDKLVDYIPAAIDKLNAFIEKKSKKNE